MAGTSSRQSVNLTLSADTLRGARALVGACDLSGTVDDLLAAFVAHAEAGRAGPLQGAARWVAASNAVLVAHGSPFDEYDLP